MVSGDTIFALATAVGRAGIAVFRLSGPEAGNALLAMTGAIRVPEARKAIRYRMVSPDTDETLDDGMIIWFPGPKSLTGEDVAELHIHGGTATVDAIARALSALPGLRPAEPGEFTKRAFLGGKIDLTAAEALVDLVDAETEAQRRQAINQMGGGLFDRLEAWRATLIDILARTEACIDFPDEDLPVEPVELALAEVGLLADEVCDFLADSHRGERLRNGLKVAIIGAPNAGKSTLLNALSAREVAIVSDTAGTTRDVIEVHLDLAGWPVTLADTAGLREAGDMIENEGVRRALARAADADLRLIVFDGTKPPDAASIKQLTEFNAIAVLNKSDLGGFHPDLPEPVSAVRVSAKTGHCIEDLLLLIQKSAIAQLQGATAPLTRMRHRQALEECAECLARAQRAKRSELIVEDLRLAVRALGRVTGRVDVEEILDAVFGEFCIGK
ncbi:MAG: tRNA uridine-5-carboxymethylaminomethyl(34) synthesis GTPase MnmE [Pseudomonadota bacterium]|nr:tRNA uridine-5-carboxymethylaminomethyl(34) synthesis GTPase MnmE [Pseudomonadota bacterium]